jgi:hypothetical protein
MRWSKASLLIVLTGLAACSPSPRQNAQASKVPGQSRPIGHTPEPVRTAIPTGPLLFHGYACGADCIGHQKGYSWASAHKISDPMDCRGTSETFIEGCRAFAGIEGPLGARTIDVSFPHMTGID